MSTDAMRAALNRAFQLGQTYWQQADSDSYKQNAKSDVTMGTFRALVDETCAAIAQRADEWDEFGLVGSASWRACKDARKRADELVAPDIVWLWTHCKAIGMTKKSDSGSMRDDIALFTVTLKEAAAPAAPAPQRADEPVALSASEAVYGFAGWLTCRAEPVTFGSAHDAALPAELVDAFCKSQELEPPRQQWADGLKPYPAAPAAPAYEEKT